MPYRAPQFPMFTGPTRPVRVGASGFRGTFTQGYSTMPGPVRRFGIRSLTRQLDLRIAFIVSALTHGVLPIAAFGVLLLLALMGFHFDSAKPLVKKPDVEFVLLPPGEAQKPIDPNTMHRAIRDSRAGGHHDPTRPVRMTQRPPAPQQAMATAPAVVSRPAPQPAQPMVTHPAAKPVAVAKPIPVQTALQAAASTSPSAASASTGTTATAASSTAGSGEASNPDAGNPNARPGVDALAEPDFGPYMTALKRRIKDQWHPPRGNESKKVVVVFRVKKDGDLTQVKVITSSGEPTADQAAIQAVKDTFPFRALPTEYREEDIDIEFTFDYHVFGDKQRAGSLQTSALEG